MLPRLTISRSAPFIVTLPDMVFISVLALIAEVAILIRVERVTFGTWLTPSVFLAAPATAVITVAFLFGPMVGFLPLRAEAVLVWIAALPIFWAGGLAVSLLGSRRLRRQVGEPRPFAFEAESGKVALALAWLCIPVILLHLRASISAVGGLLGLGTERFEEFYGAGLGAHLLVFCTMLLIFLVGTVSRKNPGTMLTIAVLMLLILVRQVKYSVILALWAGLAYRMATGRTRLTLRMVGSFSLAAFVIFCLAYSVGFWAVGGRSLISADTYLWMARHFAGYIVSGIIPLGELVAGRLGTVPGDPAVTFAPLINLFAAATSERLVESGNEFSAFIARDGLQESNVSTLFGPLLIGLGYWGAAVYTLSLGFVSYLAFAVAMTTRNCWALAMWTFMAAMLSFAWFGSYFSLLIAIEAPVYCALLAVFFSAARTDGAGVVAARGGESAPAFDGRPAVEGGMTRTFEPGT